MTVQIRPAVLDPSNPESDDADIVLALVHALAEFQDAGEHVVASVDSLRRDGSGPTPRFQALLAEDPAGRPVGLALFYFTYSTWSGGAKLYVEDLYVDSARRGTGLGLGLMQAMARIAVEEKCVSLDLSVKTENRARSFYERLGLRRSGTWMPYQIAGSALKALAGPEHGPDQASF